MFVADLHLNCSFKASLILLPFHLFSFPTIKLAHYVDFRPRIRYLFEQNGHYRYSWLLLWILNIESCFVWGWWVTPLFILFLHIFWLVGRFWFLRSRGFPGQDLVIFKDLSLRARWGIEATLRNSAWSFELSDSLYDDWWNTLSKFWLEFLRLWF